MATQIQNDSSNLYKNFDVYLHANYKRHHSLLLWNTTFQRILQFDWPTTFWIITREPKSCQTWDWWWNIYNNILDFSENQKTLSWDHFEPFLPTFGEISIFLEKRTLSVFKSSDYLTFWKKLEFKVITHSRERCCTDE